MKRICSTLALTMALALGLSAVASADDYRGRGHRDAERHTHVVKRQNNIKFRASPRHDWRPGRHWRGDHRARRPWRVLPRYGYRPGPAYRHGGPYSYRRNSYRPGTLRNYERSTVSVWLDDVRFTVAELR